jgi:hypothetical protein
MTQCGAESSPGFGGGAALLDGFGDMRFEFFVDLAVGINPAEYVGDARPE